MDRNNIVLANAALAEMVRDPAARQIQLFVRPDTFAIDNRLAPGYPLRLFPELLVNRFASSPIELLGWVWQNRLCGRCEKRIIPHRFVGIPGDGGERATAFAEPVRRARLPG